MAYILIALSMLVPAGVKAVYTALVAQLPSVG
jgi:hypothetical protein